MKKIDYKKELKHLYKPSAKNIVTVDVPDMNFLMIDGHGDPKGKNFEEAINILFTISYTLKFMIKKGGLEIPEIDYNVRPLEGLWWADDMSDFVTGNKEKWKWTLMIAQLDIVEGRMIEEAVKKAQKKNPLILSSKWSYKKYCEGKSAHIMYIGPFEDEGPTIQSIHQYIKDLDGKVSGKHHEIYLSDFRRTAPDRLKTIIRQPFSSNKTH